MLPYLQTNRALHSPGPPLVGKSFGSVDIDIESKNISLLANIWGRYCLLNSKAVTGYPVT